MDMEMKPNLSNLQIFSGPVARLRSMQRVVRPGPAFGIV
ncbi:hypothetical protein Rsw2DRAFT_0691 [Rhodobacter ferrooxidans]|uniref:Uncharacterized protein n=1 Tax=Rhodobacter ferrooxidans TaxID=371731 RepID=C8RY13_9RHOB|nr:hypothetical protein Rsw2DRAFT_0691 [Rhodobacter sp. SW2]